MNLETKKLLFDIQQAAQHIVEYTKFMDYEGFCAHGMAQAAVERKFEIIGESLNRIARTESAVLELITDYRRIIDFRNMIAHGYDIVDTEIMWEAIQDHLPVLIRVVTDLLKNAP